MTLLSLLNASAAVQRKPEIRLTSTRLKPGDVTFLSGAGFTPDHSALSHLLKPDGSEYNPLRFRVNSKGELVHKIDSAMLEKGEFEVWIVDEDSTIASNRLRFTVE